MVLHDHDNDDRPRLPECDNCRRPYKPWEVRDSDWHLLPPEYQPLALCVGCCIRTLAASGHDPEQVTITHRTWKRLQQIWPIRLHRGVHLALGNTLRLCKVTHILSVNRVHVRLLGGGPNAGEVVAEWDGEMVHPKTGRPVLRGMGPAAR